MVRLQAQLGQGQRAHLLLGHGHVPPEEGPVGQAGAVPRPHHRIGVDRQQDGEVGKGLPRQFRRRAGDDALVGVAQPLAHGDAHLSQPPLGQDPADVLRLGGPAGEGEDLGAALDLPHRVVAAAVGADQLGVLPGGLELGAEVGQGGDAGDGDHLVVPQQGPQPLGPAVKSGVAGEEHPHRPPGGLVHIRGDVRRGDEGDAVVPLRPGLQQAGGAHQHRAVPDGLQGLAGQGGRVAHA